VSVAATGPTRSTTLWSMAQALGLLLTVALLAALVVWPQASLSLLWYAIIPVLPASFLVSTQIWRNVCPLSTLGVLTGDRVGTRRLQADWVAPAGGVGILLLAVMVPARRFLFNENGLVLAVTIAVVAVLALLGGFFFDKKGGFCNALCPVLPVERLYGQRPLVKISNPRCQPCTTCTRMACLDLMPTKSAHRMLGEWHTSTRWVTTLYGAFALAFPGFVAAYYLTPDGPMSTAVSVYGIMLLWSVGSWFVLASIFALSGMKSSQALLVCAGLAVGLYYWFAPPGIADAFGFPGSVMWSLRVISLSFVLVWFMRGWSSDGRPRAAGRAS
jgi:nitrite reductase (NADH) large subunit